MKGRLVVSFVNEQGMLEAGLDYGGLVKEFLEQVPIPHCAPHTICAFGLNGTQRVITKVHLALCSGPYCKSVCLLCIIWSGW